MSEENQAMSDDRFKFRFWDIETKEMNYDIKYAVRNDGVVELCPWGAEDRGNIIPLQSTGLRDKNGVLIFEGDVVQGVTNFYKKISGYVFWNKYKPCFCVRINDSGSLYYYGISNFKKLEVIGNIYEHPKLLGDSEQ